MFRGDIFCAKDRKHSKAMRLQPFAINLRSSTAYKIIQPITNPKFVVRTLVGLGSTYHGVVMGSMSNAIRRLFEIPSPMVSYITPDSS